MLFLLLMFLLVVELLSCLSLVLLLRLLLLMLLQLLMVQSTAAVEVEFLILSVSGPSFARDRIRRPGGIRGGLIFCGLEGEKWSEKTLVK